MCIPSMYNVDEKTINKKRPDFTRPFPMCNIYQYSTAY